MPSTTYRARVICTPLVDQDALDPDDRDLEHGIERHYLVIAGAPEDARELALDAFHDSIAIAVLEDFSIESEVDPLSAHDALRVRKCFRGRQLAEIDPPADD